MKRLTIALLALLGLLGLALCQEERKTLVKLSFDDTEGLISQLDAQGYSVQYGDECCQSPDDALGIWIGRKVPVSDVKSVVTQALRYYPRLAYYTHFGDERSGYPESLDYAIYLGGSRWTAMCETVRIPAELALRIFNRISVREDLDLFLDAVRLDKPGDEQRGPAAGCPGRAG